MYIEISDLGLFLQIYGVQKRPRSDISLYRPRVRLVIKNPKDVLFVIARFYFILFIILFYFILFYFILFYFIGLPLQ